MCIARVNRNSANLMLNERQTLIASCAAVLRLVLYVVQEIFPDPFGEHWRSIMMCEIVSRSIRIDCRVVKI